MNMKLKMSVLAGALALAAAGQASAANLDMTSTTGSDLVLSVWDSTLGVSYTRDLGINMSSFVAGVSGAANALVADATSIGNLLYSADATMVSFLSGLGAGDNVLWNVTAGRNNGGTGFMGQEYLSTTNAAAATIANQSNTNLKAFGSTATVQGYYQSTIDTMAGTSATYTSGQPNSYAGGSLLNTNWATKSVFDSTASVGSSLNFWFLTPSSTSTVAKASTAQFGSAAGVSTWTLASNGTLAFNTPVAAVPEAGDWALMLSGFGLIGFIAMRRKNQNISMTFA